MYIYINKREGLDGPVGHGLHQREGGYCYYYISRTKV